MQNKITIIIFCLCIFTASVLFANNPDTLTFAHAAELAVAASVELRHARSSQAVTEGAWRWGLRAYFPRMSITVSENDRLQQFGSDSFIKNYGLSLDQLIWDRRITMARTIERMELDLTSSRLNRMAREIAESAIAAYRNVLLSRVILEIKKAALTILEEQRKILNEEIQLGLALPVDLASADISLAEAKLDISLLQLDLAEIEKQFAELLDLDTLPTLTEKVDINRSIALPLPAVAASLAREQNPDLTEAGLSIIKRQAELRYASNSWIPTLRLTGNFGISGQRYPLTRYNWSVGINIEFNSPWFQNRLGAQAGWEPISSGQNDRTAMVQNSFTPLPDPASSFSRNQAALALSIEQENYNTILERIGRIASNAIEKCALAEQKRLLSIEAAALGYERCRVEEIRLGLGHITRLRLMEILIEQTQREIAVVQAATALLEAERELERFLDLEPGELSLFAASIRSQQ
ncbi:MAG: TolC family protein [Treponema sp.]|nr:TolC family protein [Treponema sp.]